MEEPTFIDEHPIRIYSKNISEDDEVGSLIAFSNYSFRPKELTFYGLGEFDLGRMASLENNSFFIKSSRGVFDITLGTLPFQNQIIKDNKR